MTPTHLRPLSFGDIIDGAFSLYRRNLVRFAACSLVSAAALLAGVGVIGVTAGQAVLQFRGALALVSGLLVLTAVLALVMVMWGALGWAASCAYTGRKTTVGECLETGAGACITLAGVSLMAALLFIAQMLAVLGLATALGRMAGDGSGAEGLGTALVLGGTLASGVTVVTLFSASLPAVLLEGKGPLGAAVRSVQLVQGAFGRTAGLMLVTLVIAYLPLVGIAVMTGGIESLYNPAVAAAQQDGGLTQQLLTWLANALVAPFVASAVMLMYYDRRVRGEALDVQLATERLALAGD